MKLIDIMKHSKREFLLSRNMGIMCTLVLSSMITVILVLLTFAYNLVPMYEGYLKDEHPEMLDICVEGAYYSNIELLEYYGMSNVRVKDCGFVYYDAVVEKNGMHIDVKNEFMSYPMYFVDDCKEEIVRGRVFSSYDNEKDKPYVWIGEDVSREYGCDVGDFIRVSEEDIDLGHYEVAGVFSEDSIYSDEVIYSFVPLYYKAEDNFLFFDQSIYVTLDNLEQYTYINQQLQYVFMALSSQLGDVLIMMIYFRVILVILLGIISVIGMSTVYNIFNMYISRRKRYIFIQKMLGCRTGHILYIYIIIFEIILLLSVLLSGVAIMAIVSNMNNVIGVLFGGCSINLSILPFFLIIVFLACSMFMGLSMLRLYKEIDSIDIMEIVEITE